MKILKIIKNPRNLFENPEKQETHRNPCENYEHHENQRNPFDCHENHENHSNQCKYYENHENHRNKNTQLWKSIKPQKPIRRITKIMKI